MADPVTLSVSVLALTLSATTAWLTLLRRGSVQMTQPTVIYFGPDAPRQHRDRPPPKIYLRALLFATSKRGRVIEAMYASLSRNETKQNFSIWVYGEQNLMRGSGLFVGETGIAANHHFLTPEDGSQFQFISGTYKLNIYAKLLGNSRPKLLFNQELTVSAEAADALKGSGMGLYFDWSPDSSRYIPHIHKRAPAPDPTKLWETLLPDVQG